MSVELLGLSFSFWLPTVLLPQQAVEISGVAIVIGVLSLTGISLTFWGIVGCVRYLQERRTGLPWERPRPLDAITESDIAIILAAHNEESSIGATLDTLRPILPLSQVYVGSDASTDETVAIARSKGCNVEDIQPNRGKAGVLVELLTHYRLLDRYTAILIVDADTQLDSNFLKRALPCFDDPDVVALGGHAVSAWKPHWIPRWSLFFTAYRVRLWRVLQYLMRYGQTWKHANACMILPGSYSIYRSSVLRKIDINAPGLVIEDFNVTFELNHQKLGKIAYHPAIFGIDSEPVRLRDYCKQVKRWALGFWQTVLRHGIWPGFFPLTLYVFIMEVILFAVFMSFVPLALLFFLIERTTSVTILPPLGLPFGMSLNLFDILIGSIVVDYLLTVIVAAIERKPILLLYGIGFPFMRIIDALIGLYTIPLSFVAKSDGRWVSPERSGGE